MKQKQRKEKPIEYQTREKPISVRKPLLLYFLVVCAWIGLAICIISVICFGVVRFQGQEEMLYIEKIGALEKKDVAIVPGTAVYEGSITAKAKDRLLAAMELYENHLVARIVVSGDVEETRPMTQYLIEKGIPQSDIASDEHGVDTYETLARVKEKYEEQTYYFCTQELYAKRASYLMKQLGIDGLVVCVDTMYYNEVGKNMIREYFAAVKAVVEPVIYGGKAKKSIEDKDFISVPKLEKNPHVVHADELETPKDYKILDVNPADDYDVVKAVDYARTYALEYNSMYPVFEQNCTNYVSQCLVAGGIQMQEVKEASADKRYAIEGTDAAWYSVSGKGTDGRIHYSTTTNFINTNAFIAYFTEELKYELSIYDNNYPGKLQCLKEISSGDVLIFFEESGEVAHIGLVTGIGEWNAYYCGNTNNRRDAGAFQTNEKMYAQFGILHMSGKGMED